MHGLVPEGSHFLRRTASHFAGKCSCRHGEARPQSRRTGVRGKRQGRKSGSLTAAANANNPALPGRRVWKRRRSAAHGPLFESLHLRRRRQGVRRSYRRSCRGSRNRARHLACVAARGRCSSRLPRRRALRRMAACVRCRRSVRRVRLAAPRRPPESPRPGNGRPRGVTDSGAGNGAHGSQNNRSGQCAQSCAADAFLRNRAGCRETHRDSGRDQNLPHVHPPESLAARNTPNAALLWSDVARIGAGGMPAPTPALGRRPDVGGQAPGPVSDITNAADAAPHSISM